MPETTLPEIPWDIRPEPRRLSADELFQRRHRYPDKSEVIDGELLWSEEERTALLGTLLELFGTRAVVQFGDSEAWRQAVRDLS